MRELNNLSEISNNYDTFVIDLWGVIHNGITLNSKAMETIENLNNESKKIIFLSNAPRPSLEVTNFLSKMGMNKKFLSNFLLEFNVCSLNNLNSLTPLLKLSLNGTPSPTRTDMNRSSTDFESVAFGCKSLI